METTPALRKNHRALRRMLICIGAAAILIGALLAWLGANMRSAMTALATARIRSVAAKAMNDAILDTRTIPNFCTYVKTAARYIWCRPIRGK